MLGLHCRVMNCRVASQPDQKTGLDGDTPTPPDCCWKPVLRPSGWARGLHPSAENGRMVGGWAGRARGTYLWVVASGQGSAVIGRAGKATARLALQILFLGSPEGVGEKSG